MTRQAAENNFRALFGCSPKVATDMWYLTTFTDRKTQIKHFLWGLMNMKVYSSEQVLSLMANCNRTSFRKWSWQCICDMADLMPQLVS